MIVVCTAQWLKLEEGICTHMLSWKMKKKYIGLIPTRLNSTRLPQKALMEIEGLPLVIHTYKRAKLSKLLDEVFICCDDNRIIKTGS